MSSSIYHWQSEAVSIQDNHLFSALSVQLAALTDAVKNLKAHASVNTTSPIVEWCKFCGGGHSMEQCQNTMEGVQFMASMNQNNPYSSIYNPGWRDHPDFYWDQDHWASAPSAEMFNPLWLNVGGLNQQDRAPPVQEPSLEERMMIFIQNQDAILESQAAILENQAAALKNLETQVDQLASAIHVEFQGALSSDTMTNPLREDKEHYDADILKSGTKFEENTRTTEFEMGKEAEAVVTDEREKSLEKKDEKATEQCRPPPLFPQYELVGEHHIEVKGDLWNEIVDDCPVGDHISWIEANGLKLSLENYCSFGQNEVADRETVDKGKIKTEPLEVPPWSHKPLPHRMNQGWISAPGMHNSKAIGIASAWSKLRRTPTSADLLDPG